jgi:hypothetical protein
MEQTKNRIENETSRGDGWCNDRDGASGRRTMGKGEREDDWVTETERADCKWKADWLKFIHT